MTKNVTCIVCPKGCKITVEHNNGDIIDISGHTCKRGYSYACDEAVDPKRTITTTMKNENGATVSVKTDKPIKKGLMFECMKVINSTVVEFPVRIGDILIKNILDTDVNIVATSNAELCK